MKSVMLKIHNIINIFSSPRSKSAEPTVSNEFMVSSSPSMEIAIVGAAVGANVARNGVIVSNGVVIVMTIGRLTMTMMRKGFF